MNEPASTLYATAEKLGRRIRIIRVQGQEVVEFLDGQPAPAGEDWDEALAAVKTRKVISAAQFAALFTPEEKHSIYRRASQSVATSSLAPHFAALLYRFMQLDFVRSDAQELTEALTLLEDAQVINAARRARIAAFLPPT